MTKEEFDGMLNDLESIRLTSLIGATPNRTVELTIEYSFVYAKDIPCYFPTPEPYYVEENKVLFWTKTKLMKTLRDIHFENWKDNYTPEDDRVYGVGECWDVILKFYGNIPELHYHGFLGGPSGLSTLWDIFHRAIKYLDHEKEEKDDYHKGFINGERKSKEKIINKLFKMSSLSDEDIADILDIKLSSVEEMRKRSKS